MELSTLDVAESTHNVPQLTLLFITEWTRAIMHRFLMKYSSLGNCLHESALTGIAVASAANLVPIQCLPTKNWNDLSLRHQISALQLLASKMCAPLVRTSGWWPPSPERAMKKDSELVHLQNTRELQCENSPKCCRKSGEFRSFPWPQVSRSEKTGGNELTETPK